MHIIIAGVCCVAGNCSFWTLSEAEIVAAILRLFFPTSHLMLLMKRQKIFRKGKFFKLYFNELY